MGPMKVHCYNKHKVAILSPRQIRLRAEDILFETLINFLLLTLIEEPDAQVTSIQASTLDGIAMATNSNMHGNLFLNCFSIYGQTTKTIIFETMQLLDSEVTIAIEVFQMTLLNHIASKWNINFNQRLPYYASILFVQFHLCGVCDLPILHAHG
ncbi:hypothetical protein ACJX0J_033592 [Zea mays]